MIGGAIASGCAPSPKASARPGPGSYPLPPDSGGSASKATSPEVRSHPAEARRRRLAPPQPRHRHVSVAVRPGDSLWSIAERIVSARRPDPSVGDVARYWRELIEANRSRLPEPSDPSLIFPGDELLLPALPLG